VVCFRRKVMIGKAGNGKAPESVSGGLLIYF
jgi:hypothetical protein